MEQTAPLSIEEYSLGSVDSIIRYPSYKSLDEFVDVARLQSLDQYITTKIETRLNQQTDLQFFTGPYRLNNSFPSRPGSKMIYLAASKQPDNYFDLDKTELWQRTSDADDYKLLMDFIETLPFKATGRMLIMYDDVSRAVSPHRDHVETDVCHEFIWFRTNFKKPFYMLNNQTNEKQYVNHYTAWFDSVNQYHGGDAVEGLTFSIRVDGKFTDEFRKQIPRPSCNLASTPSYWSAIESQKQIGTP